MIVGTGHQSAPDRAVGLSAAPTFGCFTAKPGCAFAMDDSGLQLRMAHEVSADSEVYRSNIDMERDLVAAGCELAAQLLHKIVSGQLFRKF